MEQNARGAAYEALPSGQTPLKAFPVQWTTERHTSDAGHDNNNSTSSKLELMGPCSEIEKE